MYVEKLLHDIQEKINTMNEIYHLEYQLDEIQNKYPFNSIEQAIVYLIHYQILSLPEYLHMREAYFARNQYLSVFEINAPRTFGENWGQGHLKKIIPQLEKPSKNLDPDYSGQYDFWYQGIRIEVKASRAVKKMSGKSLAIKALNSESKERFNMNFQQQKPSCADVFVWIGVWTDKIRYWVLSSEEVKGNHHYSKGQHRGNRGEGQLWIKENNIDEFSKYEVEEQDILKRIVETAHRGVVNG